MHLPIPRFTDENEFYREMFGNVDLWLDISYDFANKSGLVSGLGHSYSHQLQTVPGLVHIKKYDWVDIDLKKLRGQHEITLTSTGRWTTAKDSEIHDSVCVFNVPIPNCSNCPDETFCRYTDEKKEHSHCVCADWEEGELCESESAIYFGSDSPCENQGYKYFNEHANEIECVCPYPFQGRYCDISK